MPTFLQTLKALSPMSAAFALLLLLGGCGGAVDPGDRAPLPEDYEPPPIDGFPSHEPPSRV